MNDANFRLTHEQLAYIIDKTGIQDPKQAIERFAELMKMEGIPPRKIVKVVTKLMERERNRR